MDRLTEPVERSFEADVELLERIPTLDHPEQVRALERLLRLPNPALRGAAQRLGSTILSEDRLVGYLRDGRDDVLRNAGLEMLRLRGARSFELAATLLADRDSDVVLQAVQVLDHLRDPRGFEYLARALQHPNMNVVQAAIVAIGHLGDSRGVAVLLPFLQDEVWYQMAAVQALGDLRSRAAVASLERVASDETLGPTATDALARIGGAAAFRALARLWLRFDQDLESEVLLGLLAHVAEGLRRPPRSVTGLRTALVAELGNPLRQQRVAAARCLLPLGPGPEDLLALSQLVNAYPDPDTLPRCLSKRKDLADYLLAQRRAPRAWGFLLCARYPGAGTVAHLVAALMDPVEPELLDAVVQGLSKVRDPDLAPAILDYYLRLPASDQPAFDDVLQAHQTGALRALHDREDLDAPTRLTLWALLGGPGDEIVAAITALPPESQLAVIGRVSDCPAVTRLLPWARWLEEEPGHYGRLASEVAISTRAKELLPGIRALAADTGLPEAVRALGELGDQESVPALAALLERAPERLRPVVLDALGRLGGVEARRALRRTATSAEPAEARIAYMALAACATAADVPIFKKLSNDPDWYVRMACVEVLGRRGGPGQRATLARLVTDANPSVARRAETYLARQSVTP